MTLRTRGAGRLLGLVALALAAPATLNAQDYDVSVGWGGGYISYAPFVEKGAATPADIGAGATWVAVLQAESWQLRRWVGVRVGGFYSNGSMTYPTAEKDLGIFGVEAAGLFRVLPPSPERIGTFYLIGGAGLMWYDLGEGPNVPVAGAQVLYREDEQRQFMALGGAGVELLTALHAAGGQIGFRLEAVDLVALSGPFRVIGGASPDPSHNLRFSVSVFSGVPSLF